MNKIFVYDVFGTQNFSIVWLWRFSRHTQTPYMNWRPSVINLLIAKKLRGKQIQSEIYTKIVLYFIYLLVVTIFVNKIISFLYKYITVSRIRWFNFEILEILVPESALNHFSIHRNICVECMYVSKYTYNNKIN